MISSAKKGVVVLNAEPEMVSVHYVDGGQIMALRPEQIQPGQQQLELRVDRDGVVFQTPYAQYVLSSAARRSSQTSVVYKCVVQLLQFIPVTLEASLRADSLLLRSNDYERAILLNDVVQYQFISKTQMRMQVGVDVLLLEFNDILFTAMVSFFLGKLRKPRGCLDRVQVEQFGANSQISGQDATNQLQGTPVVQNSALLKALTHSKVFRQVVTESQATDFRSPNNFFSRTEISEIQQTPQVKDRRVQPMQAVRTPITNEVATARTAQLNTSALRNTEAASTLSDSFAAQTVPDISAEPRIAIREAAPRIEEITAGEDSRTSKTEPEAPKTPTNPTPIAAENKQEPVRKTLKQIQQEQTVEQQASVVSEPPQVVLPKQQETVVQNQVVEQPVLVPNAEAKEQAVVSVQPLPQPQQQEEKKQETTVQQAPQVEAQEVPADAQQRVEPARPVGYPAIMEQTMFSCIAPNLHQTKKCYFRLYKDPDDQVLRLYYGFKQDFKPKDGIFDIREVYVQVGDATAQPRYFQELLAKAVDPGDVYIPQVPSYRIKLVLNKPFLLTQPENLTKKQSKAVEKAMQQIQQISGIKKAGCAEFFTADGEMFIALMQSQQALDTIRDIILGVQSDYAMLQ